MIQRITSGVILLLVYGGITACLTSDISEFHRIKRDAGKARCKLPPPQLNGKFSPSPRRCVPDNTFPECQMTPGNLVPHNWPLYHSCDPGYALNRTNDVSVCLDGQWRPALPGCVRLCPPLESPGVALKCVLRGREVPCNSDMKPGTDARVECPQFYISGYEVTCLDDGNWAQLKTSSRLAEVNDNNTDFHCDPECGLPSNLKHIGSISIASVTETIRMYPWVAGIYRKDKEDKWDLVCAGTLISLHIVITAAHCVVTRDNVKFEPGDVRVGLGKYYKSFYKAESSSVIYEVENVVVHDSYKGLPMFYAMDIALLGLLVDVRVSAFIMPACVDWSHTLTPATGTTVTLAGWSKTDNDTRGESLTSVQLRFIQKEDCFNRLQQRLQRYLTADKSCVEKLDGNQTHVGISGAGVTFEAEGRHFIVGFLSTKIPDHRTLIFTTNITFGEHARWIGNGRDLLDKIHLKS